MAVHRSTVDPDQDSQNARALMTSLANHPEKNVIRLQLRQNVVLQGLSDEDRTELESHLAIVDGHKGEFLLLQGVREMQQYFVLDGNPELVDRIPQKELASYLNLTADTLSRLGIAGRSSPQAALASDSARAVSGSASKRSNPV